jgi:hypothetical protein
VRLFRAILTLCVLAVSVAAPCSPLLAAAMAGSASAHRCCGHEESPAAPDGGCQTRCATAATRIVLQAPAVPVPDLTPSTLEATPPRTHFSEAPAGVSPFVHGPPGPLYLQYSALLI